MTEAGKPMTWTVEPRTGMVRITAPWPDGHSTVWKFSPEDTRRLAVGLWQGAAMADAQMPKFSADTSNLTVSVPQPAEVRKTLPQRIRAAVGVAVYTIVLGALLCSIR